MSPMNNLPPLPLVNGVLEIDNSFMEKLIACPRSLEYDRLLKRRSAATSAPLTFGSAIHAALEYRYKVLGNTSPTIMDMQDIFDKVLQPFFDKNPQPEDDHRGLGFAFELMQQYVARYPAEPFQLITNASGEVMSEMSFSTLLCELSISRDLEAINETRNAAGEIVYTRITLNAGSTLQVYYTGRVDLPVIWDGQLIVIDHKTTSMLGSYYFDGQKVSPQFEGYAWAFERITSRKVTGFCINAIRTKEKPMKPRGSWDAWWDEGFARHKEYLRPGQLDEWRWNIIALLETFMFHYSRDYMPMQKKACTIYGKCPYFDVCYLPTSSRQQMLASDQYTNNTWSPLK